MLIITEFTYLLHEILLIKPNIPWTILMVERVLQKLNDKRSLYFEFSINSP